MSESLIRAAIKIIVESVANVGVVHDYERWNTEYAPSSKAYTTTINGAKVIRGWSISCNQVIPTGQIISGSRGTINKIDYVYKARMYFGLDDEQGTEKTAMLLAISVMTALNDDNTMAALPSFPDLARIDIFEARMYFGLLVHYAEITQQVTELV